MYYDNKVRTSDRSMYTCITVHIYYNTSIIYISTYLIDFSSLGSRHMDGRLSRGTPNTYVLEWSISILSSPSIITHNQHEPNNKQTTSTHRTHTRKNTQAWRRPLEKEKNGKNANETKRNMNSSKQKNNGYVVWRLESGHAVSFRCGGVHPLAVGKMSRRSCGDCPFVVRCQCRLPLAVSTLLSSAGLQGHSCQSLRRAVGPRPTPRCVLSTRTGCWWNTPVWKKRIKGVLRWQWLQMQSNTARSCCKR